MDVRPSRSGLRTTDASPPTALRSLRRIAEDMAQSRALPAARLVPLCATPYLREGVLRANRSRDRGLVPERLSLRGRSCGDLLGGGGLARMQWRRPLAPAGDEGGRDPDAQDRHDDAERHRHGNLEETSRAHLRAHEDQDGGERGLEVTELVHGSRQKEVER